MVLVQILNLGTKVIQDLSQDQQERGPQAHSPAGPQFPEDLKPLYSMFCMHAQTHVEVDVFVGLSGKQAYYIL